MNILLTNDDGYFEPRIKILKNILEVYGDVYVSAPKFENSGQSCSITIKKPITYEIVSEREIVVNGTPADSCCVGLTYFSNIKFDLIVSGVNKGHNEGKDILFSGTIGAGLMGTLEDINAIALSSEDENLDILKSKTEFILKYIFENKLYSKFLYLNVNYPYKSFEIGKGIKVGRIYPTPKNEKLVKTDDNSYMVGARSIVIDNMVDSDRNYTNNGYYSITPLKPSLENKDDIDELKKIING